MNGFKGQMQSMNHQMNLNEWKNELLQEWEMMELIGNHKKVVRSISTFKNKGLKKEEKEGKD